MVVNDVFTCWQLACPSCRARLEAMPDRVHCVDCAAEYPRLDGIWHCMAPERVDVYSQFELEYQTIRRAEGWGGETADYYRALPWQDLSGRFSALWQMRARSYSTLVSRVLPKLEGSPGERVRTLDLGAGNGWLAYRLSLRSHEVAAIDVQVDRLDGLGAHTQYDAPFTAIQAEFDHLPFADQQVDLAVFNGSLHYTPDYEVSLREVLRVLRPTGVLAIVDTPMYSRTEVGTRMIRERYARFRKAYGFNSDALASEQFMTRDRLRALGQALNVRWELTWPFHGLVWSLRPWMARLRGRREPAQFPLIVGTRV